MITEPELARLDEEDRRIEGRLSRLRTQWIEQRLRDDGHPEAVRRLDQLTTEIDALDRRLTGAVTFRSELSGLAETDPGPEPRSHERVISA